MAKSLSEKNTKSDILDAYNELLAKTKEQKAADQKAAKADAEKAQTVKAAADNTMDDIVKRLATLKLEIVKNIDSLEEKMIAEHRRFMEIQQAIEFQSASLEKMYGIQAEAGSLTALILAQKERRILRRRDGKEKDRIRRRSEPAEAVLEERAGGV